MVNLIKQKSVKKFLTSQAFLFILIVAAIWIALVCVKITNKNHQIKEEIISIKKRIEQLKKDNQILAEQIDLFNDPSFIEKEAKRRLNLRKEGEEVVILPEAKTFENQTTTMANNLEGQESFFENQEKTDNNKEESNLIKWWRYFFH